MTQHILQGRTEHELTWYRRRGFLQAAAAWTALGGFAAAHAQQRTNIVELQGDAQLNGRALRPQDIIQTGDRIQTGPGSHLVFVVGNAAFQVRPNSNIAVERGETLDFVSILRLLTGAVVSVWGKGGSRNIVTPTLTAGIRGTGVYTEVFPQQDDRSYFCNCYGVVDLAVGNDRVESVSQYHQSFWSEKTARNGHLMSAARPINHTDEELEYLAGLVGQRTAWQLAGHKGTMDGSGRLDPGSGYGNPLAPGR